MRKNFLSSFIVGMALIILGLGLFLAAIYFKTWLPLIYGIPSFVIGFFILFNKNEDRIEMRKDKKSERRVK